MRVGIGSWTYPWAIGVDGFEPAQPLTVPDLLRRASELGVTVVQIADNMPLHRSSAAELDSLVALADELGVELELGTCGFGVEHLRTYLELAKTVGSPFLRVVIDSPGHEPSVEEILSTLGMVLPGFEEAGIDLLIENHDRFTAIELAGIMRKANSPRIGIVLDTVNSLGALESVETVLSELAPWVRNVHIKDVGVSRHPNRMGFHVAGVPAGTGGLRLEALVQDLRALDSDLSLIIEQWPPFAGTLENTIKIESEWARTSVENLVRLVGRESAAV